VRLAAKYRPGVPILVLTKNQAVANACSMIRAAVPLVLGEQAATLERSGLVCLVSAAACAWLVCSARCALNAACG
jgi:pyruvate kinase